MAWHVEYPSILVPSMQWGLRLEFFAAANFLWQPMQCAKFDHQNAYTNVQMFKWEAFNIMNTLSLLYVVSSLQQDCSRSTRVSKGEKEETMSIDTTCVACRALRTGSAYDVLAMFRLIQLWLSYADNRRLNHAMKDALLHVASHKFLVLAYQIASRLAAPHKFESGKTDDLVSAYKGFQVKAISMYFICGNTESVKRLFFNCQSISVMQLWDLRLSLARLKMLSYKDPWKAICKL